MKAKVLMTLLLSTLALPVLADEANSGLFIGAGVMQVAQLGPEERRLLRERWEQAGPEERAEMRREFQDRLRQLSPEEREARRRQFMERRGGMPPERPVRPRDSWLDRAPNPVGGGDAGGFGTGFERRMPGPWGPPENMPAPEPRRNRR